MEGGDAVSGVVAQWPILAVFLAGAGMMIGAWKLWGQKEKPEAIASGDHGGILAAVTSINATITTQGSATIAHIDQVAEGLNARFTAHEARDNERFDKVFGLINEPRQAWTDEQRRSARIERNTKVFGK